VQLSSRSGRPDATRCGVVVNLILKASIKYHSTIAHILYSNVSILERINLFFLIASTYTSCNVFYDIVLVKKNTY